MIFISISHISFIILIKKKNYFTFRLKIFYVNYVRKLKNLIIKDYLREPWFIILVFIPLKL